MRKFILLIYSETTKPNSLKSTAKKNIIGMQSSRFRQRGKYCLNSLDQFFQRMTNQERYHQLTGSELEYLADHFGEISEDPDFLTDSDEDYLPDSGDDNGIDEAQDDGLTKQDVTEDGESEEQEE